MADVVHRPGPGETVLSCPACWSWQLHYTTTDLVPEVFKDETVLDFVVETLLAEHVARECTQPMFFAKLARSRGII